VHEGRVLIWVWLLGVGIWGGCESERGVTPEKGSTVIGAGDLAWYQPGSSKRWSDGTGWTIRDTVRVGAWTTLVQVETAADGTSRRVHRYLEETGLYEVDPELGTRVALLLRLPLKVGVRWEVRDGLRYVCTGEEWMEVPAGIFYCLKVERRGGQTGDIGAFWVAKTVGCIRWVVSGMAVELESYTLLRGSS
jgi:hypothetical protein